MKINKAMSQYKKGYIDQVAEFFKMCTYIVCLLMCDAYVFNFGVLEAVK